MKKATIVVLLVLCFTLALPLFFQIPSVQATPASTVASGANLDTKFGHQRKNFYADGYHFQFYSDGTNIYYKSSSDGITWGSQQTVRGGTAHQCCIFWDGSYVYLIVSVTASPAHILYYRRGMASGGTISWDTEYSFHPRGISGGMAFYPSLVADSSGRPFIGYYGHTGSAMDGYWVSRCNNGEGSGTWTHQQISSLDTQIYGCLVTLTSDKIFGAYKIAGASFLYGKLWDGSSWGSQEQCTTTFVYSLYLSMTNIGDDVLLAFLTNIYDIKYRKRTYGTGWGSEENVEVVDATTDSFPSISTDGMSVWVFWEYGDTIYYRRRDGSWDTKVSWITGESTTNGASVTAFYRAYSNRIGCVWVKDVAGTKYVRYDFFTTPCTLTFYFNIGGEFRVDNATITNGTQNTYVNGTVIELCAVTENESYVFKNFTWNGNSHTTNPYDLSVTSDLTVWCYFVDPPAWKVGGQEHIADLVQALSSTWQTAVQWTSNVVGTFATSISQSISLSTDFIVDVTQGFGTTWDVLMQWDGNVLSSLSLSTSWEIVIESVFNVLSSVSLIGSWSVDLIQGTQRVVDLTITIVTQWTVDVVGGIATAPLLLVWIILGVVTMVGFFAFVFWRNRK